MSQKPFVLPIRTALGYYFYEVNRNELVAVTEQLYEYLLRILDVGDTEMIEASEEVKTQYLELQDCGYLQPVHIEKVVHPLTGKLEDLLDRRIDKITLQITQNCNLRCSYCVYSENSNLGQRSHSSKVMSLETAKKALDFYHQHSIDSEKISIGFYGGEPLLAFPFIKDVVAYAEDIFDGKSIIYAITTNATLLTDEVIDYLLDKNFNVMISIDGPKRVQDKNRKFKNGTGSYDVVMRNINRLYQKDPEAMKRMSVSMVIDPSQDYSEIITLFDEPALKDINLTYTFVEEDARYLLPSEDYVVQYTYDLFLTLLKHFRDQKEHFPSKLVETDLNSIMDGNTRFKLNLVGLVGAPSGPCVPGKIRMLVNCFGDFYPCERVNENECMKIGSIERGFDFDQVSSILNVGQIAEQSCKNCWAFSLCNICAKRVDDNGKMTAERKLQACTESKSAAFSKLMNKILVYENEVHIRKMMSEDVL